MGKLLLRWVVGESNTLLDVAFQAFHSSLEEALLVIVKVRKRVQSLLCTIGLRNVSGGNRR